MLAALARAGQARPLRGLLALTGLGVCLTSPSDPLRLLVGGTIGVLALGLALQRDAPGRLLFGGLALLLLVSYAWSIGALGPSDRPAARPGPDSVVAAAPPDDGALAGWWMVARQLTMDLFDGPAPLPSDLSSDVLPVSVAVALVLRAWLVGLSLLALVTALAPLGRWLGGSGGWLVPPGAGLVVLALLAAAGALLPLWLGAGASASRAGEADGLIRQARGLLEGHLGSPTAGAGFVGPGYLTLLALGELAGAPGLVSPLASGLTVLVVAMQGRRVFGAASGLLAGLLLLTAPAFLAGAARLGPDPVVLLLVCLGVLLVTRAERGEGSTAPALAGLCLGWLIATDPSVGLAGGAVAVAWLGIGRLRRGRGLGVLVPLLLAACWPVLGLLAYNRAATGTPVLVAPGTGSGGDWLAALIALQRLLFGWPRSLSLAFALLPFGTGRARAGDWLHAVVAVAVGATLAWPGGTAPAGAGVAGLAGPTYATLGCLALLTARGVVAASEATSAFVPSRLRRRATPSTAPLFVALVLVLAAVSLAATVRGQAGPG